MQPNCAIALSPQQISLRPQRGRAIQFHPVQRIEDQIRRHHLSQFAEPRPIAREAAVLRQLVDRRAAATDREVIARIPTRRHAKRNVARHALHHIARLHLVQ
jgi:hypothetical protein